MSDTQWIRQKLDSEQEWKLLAFYVHLNSHPSTYKWHWGHCHNVMISFLRGSLMPLLYVSFSKHLVIIHWNDFVQESQRKFLSNSSYFDK